MDYVQWTGSPPSQGTSWEEAAYTYDPAGRRIEKDIDGDTRTYVYTERTLLTGVTAVTLSPNTTTTAIWRANTSTVRALGTRP